MPSPCIHSTHLVYKATNFKLHNSTTKQLTRNHTHTHTLCPLSKLSHMLPSIDFPPYSTMYLRTIYITQCIAFSSRVAIRQRFTKNECFAFLPDDSMPPDSMVCHLYSWFKHEQEGIRFEVNKKYTNMVISCQKF